MNTGKRYTISDIAREVGVSTATISRYLNGHYEYMSTETRERIKKTIAERNYHPSLVAKGLKVNKGYLFGVVMAHINTTMASTVIRGICQACSDTQYSPLFLSIEDDARRENACIQRLLDHRVEGIITMTGCNYDYYKKLNVSGIAVVACDRMEAGVELDSVTVDHEGTITNALKRLYDGGYREFSLITSDVYRMPQSTIIKRENAFAAFCEAHGIQAGVYRIDPENTEAGIRRVLIELRSLYMDKKGAVFVTNSPLLFRVDRAFSDLGIRYPDEMGLWGYDLPSDDYHTSQRLTVIEQPLMDMAKQTFELLINRIEGSPLPFPQTIVLPGRFVERSSLSLK